MSRKPRTTIIASVITLACVIAATGAAEIIARGQLSSRITELGGAIPGVSVTLSQGLVLPPLASGSVNIDLAVSDTALNTYAQCRTDQDISVHAREGTLIVTAQRTLRGMTLPVEVLLVPRRDGDQWFLVADSVSAAGISLPADRALKVLTGNNGAGSNRAARLLEGIPLPSEEGLTLTSIRVTDGAVLVTASTAINRTPHADSGGLSGLRSCSDNQEG